ncbi:MAG: PKD domain-containing protein [Actinomycetales bacterium]|nr:PKD domain-containing protein [Candidatus Phosphoribacter baldrii]
MKTRWASSAILLLLASLGPAPLAAADSDGGNGGFVNMAAKQDGLEATTNQSAVANLASGRDLQGNAFGVPMVFSVRIACQVADPGDPDPSACQKAALGCLTNGQQAGIGLLYDIYSRAAGSSDPWHFVGSTCFADQVPGASPTLSMGRIIDAFHLTPWATATVLTQPEGNTTLVNLPVYARISWSVQGYQPGEIDTLDPARMVGFNVQIRPKVDHYTYVWGDGTTTGPSRSDGGVWPTGDITHSYPSPGTYQARVDTTFTGDFRINGGPWTQIPDTVTITGPTTTITVHAAKAVLVG